MNSKLERGHANGWSSLEARKAQGRAHNAVARAISEGKLVRPEKCEKCGDEPGLDASGKSKIVGHHYKGYDNPLDVEWLCQRCNIREGSLRDPNEPEPLPDLDDILEGGQEYLCGGVRLTNRNLRWYGQPGYERKTAELDKAAAEQEALNSK